MNRRTAFAVAALVSGAVLLGLATHRDASAQGFDPRRGAELVVGQAPVPCALDRLDGARSGRALVAVGRGPLRTRWTKALGVSVGSTPLVDARGRVHVLSNRGQAVWLGPDGEELGRVGGLLGSAAGASTSDGTLVATTGGGQAVGIRGGQRTFEVRLGAGREPAVAPLPLEDGGSVVVAGRDAAVLDAQGTPRFRVEFPEPIAYPPLVGRGELLLVDDKGVVRAWTPGKPPRRVGAFGSPPDASPARDGDTLVAVVRGAGLVSVDLRRGTSTPRVTPPSGALLLGPPSLTRNGELVLGLATTGRLAALRVDRAGAEVSRVALAVLAASGADAGTAALERPPFPAPFVDAAGAFVFAAPDGRVGIADGAGVASSEPLCATSRGIAALAPAPGGVVVVCEDGLVVRLDGR